MRVAGAGVAHAVAAVDWRSVVHLEHEVLHRVRRREWSAAWVEQRQEVLLEQVAAGAFGRGGARGGLPASPVLLSAEDVRGPAPADRWLDRWWRLDVLLALEDALDDPVWDEPV